MLQPWVDLDQLTVLGHFVPAMVSQSHADHEPPSRNVGSWRLISTQSVNVLEFFLNWLPDFHIISEIIFLLVMEVKCSVSVQDEPEDKKQRPSGMVPQQSTLGE